MHTAYNFSVPAFLVSILLSIPAFSFGQEIPAGIKAQSIEDWESGDFSQYNWQFDGNAEWFITESNPYEGDYSARSEDISDNQNAILYLEYTVYAPDVISFWYKVSSESGWDYLNFYIDNVLKDSWSGTVPWSFAEYNVTAGPHTFKWEYDKDYSLSYGEDCAWVDLITFPPEEIEAIFQADTTIICEGDVVYFTDQSIGPVTEWNWTFEGGEPATSTEQNPVIAYNEEGSWDVSLEVTDGIESSSFYLENYIQVGSIPSMANKPIGISNLCASWGNTAYSTIPLGGNVVAYDWVLDPPEAGSVSGNGSTNITIIWEEGYLGVSDLTVAGINYCGTGAYSDPLVITRYLPDVVLVLPAYVALPEPPFELSGGFPVGGEYTGDGVSNGWFDPAAAGMGEHIITYTYTDLNLCSNSATDIITVTEFIGVDEHNVGNTMRVFPNPNNGEFRIQLDQADAGEYHLQVIDAVNTIVYQEDQVKLGGDRQKHIDLELASGIYFIKITGNTMGYFRKIIVQ